MTSQMTRKTILIVCDSLAARKYLDNILRTYGYHVLLADDDRQCLELLKIERPDIIVFDVSMPDLNCNEVYHMIKTDDRLKDIPVLMFVSASEIKEEIKGIKAGSVNDYIVKPFIAKELIARIAGNIKSGDLVRRLQMEVAERKKAEIELGKAKDELERRVEKRTSELKLVNKKLKRERKQLKQALRALRESEAIFKALVHNVPGMVYKAYSDWSARVFSGCMDLCGYSEKELNSKDDNWLSIIHPDDKDLVYKDGSILCHESKNITQTYRIICKNGDIRWVEDHKASFFSENGEFLSIYGIVFDITERKQIEEALYESELRFQGLINTMNEGLVEVDENWTMIFVNNRFAEMMGFKADQLVGRNFQDLISREFKTKSQEDQICRKNGQVEVFELELERADEQTIFVLCSPKPYYDSNGKYSGCLGVVTDITARKNVELQLLREKEKLENALAKIKTLSGLLPICANCKRIRDDKGYWNQLESYISSHSDVLFSHSICPDCKKKLYPEISGNGPLPTSGKD